MLTWLRTVSYTHLDVYKRQVFTFGPNLTSAFSGEVFEKTKPLNAVRKTGTAVGIRGSLLKTPDKMCIRDRLQTLKGRENITIDGKKIMLYANIGNSKEMCIRDRALGFVGGMLAANGKSGFLGALVAGFLAGYLIVGLRKICDKLPEAIEKLAPVLIYPVVGILIMGLAMNFVVEPVMGGINTGLNNFLSGMGDSSRIVLGLILRCV